MTAAPNIIILTALAAELDVARIPDGVQVMFTGVGKVNTAIATMQVLQRATPALVINYGTAGKIDPALHGLVEISRVIQRDMNAEPLSPRGVTPLMDGPHHFSSSHEGVICGTGDSFVTSVDPWLIENNVGVVDMELYAIAAVCHHYNVPWRSFKYITDDANDEAADHWNNNVADGQDLFWMALRREGLLR